MRIYILSKKNKKKKDCGGFQKAKGHLDTQMYPECEGSKYDRNIVKKTVENRKATNTFNLSATSENDIDDLVYSIQTRWTLDQIVDAIKALGEESIAGFKGLVRTEVLGILNNLEMHELNKIKDWLTKNAHGEIARGGNISSTVAGCEKCKLNFKTSQTKPSPPAIYTYHINLDERGSFFADVRNPSGNTVFEIKAGNEIEDGDSSIFEDGFMKNKNDIAGLKEYLIQLGIMKPQQTLIKA